mmetsp:Transcript_14521/g.34832  ORF Transcript_14521/g.34832 Transcript_14521/m.34832 type:complete len:98 (+) Transcript_14521:44-337(+)
MHTYIISKQLAGSHFQKVVLLQLIRSSNFSCTAPHDSLPPSPSSQSSPNRLVAQLTGYQTRTTAIIPTAPDQTDTTVNKWLTAAVPLVGSADGDDEG